MRKIIIAVVVVAVIAVGAFILTNDSSENTNNVNPTSAPPPTPPPSSDTSTPPPAEQSLEATITYSDSGFSPSTITVKSGATITIKNSSSEALQFQSDPHPQHTDNVELNAGSVSEGGSKTFTVTKKGSFGYHNHLNPNNTGTIVVQ